MIDTTRCGRLSGREMWLADHGKCQKVKVGALCLKPMTKMAKYYIDTESGIGAKYVVFECDLFENCEDAEKHTKEQLAAHQEELMQRVAEVISWYRLDRIFRTMLDDALEKERKSI